MQSILLATLIAPLAFTACSSSDLSGTSAKATDKGNTKTVNGSVSTDKDPSAAGATTTPGGKTPNGTGDPTTNGVKAVAFYAPINAPTALPASYGACTATQATAGVVCDAAAHTVASPTAGPVEIQVTTPDGTPTTAHVIFFDPATPPTDPAYQAQIAANPPSGQPGGDPASVTSDALAALVGANQDLKAISGWLQSTPEGTHKVGGLPCPSGTVAFGSVADCSGTNGVTCYGNLVFCAAPATLTADPNRLVTVDIQMTPEGTHKVGGLPCADGYAAFGGFPDCGLSNCFGNQLLCAKQVALGSLHAGDQIVTNFTSTPEGAHVAGGPGCPAGLTAIGSTADCGLATGQGQDCFGNQLFCVAKAPLK